MAELDRFLEDALGKRFQDGTWDCGLMVAAWVEQVTGVDPATPWRGRYSTQLGWLRILKREGGLKAVLGRGAVLSKLIETKTPRRGDIGVVNFGSYPLAAICLGERWAAVGERGLVVQKPAVEMAWRLPCQRPF